jgi:hypothetical protein
MPVTLYIPNLSRLCNVSASLPRCPALETLLSRAQLQTLGDERGVLEKLFGLPAGFGAAPFMRLADSGKRDADYYFCADPVHLAPDRDQLVMLPVSVLHIQSEEARALTDVFNHTYATDGYRLETPYPGRWYLRIPSPLNCTSTETAQVAGGAVFEFMPQGKDGWHLKQLMNEIQMLFYQLPINQIREAAGRPAINSLWLWGGGRLPERPITGPSRVVTDMPLAAGLAQVAGSELSSLPDKFNIASQPENQLIAINCASDQELTQLEEQIAAPLLWALRKSRFKELLIYPADTKGYRLTRVLLRKLWRRRQPLADILRIA